jgi:hypothetical protein
LDWVGLAETSPLTVFEAMGLAEMIEDFAEEVGLTEATLLLGVGLTEATWGTETVGCCLLDNVEITALEVGATGALTAKGVPFLDVNSNISKQPEERKEKSILDRDSSTKGRESTESGGSDQKSVN